ncbi:DUF3179 domain-containing protein [Algihabitans albus]|uniref:DUF3179 domain-containing protein n=1 Tax=Algihabitans albus TaxID=2164067 RepID=UPI000E5CB350|nr:DUF3179 domain-containing protein [Algihabitans albus]
MVRFPRYQPVAARSVRRIVQAAAVSLAVGLSGPAVAQLSDDEILSHSLDLVFGDRSEALQSLEILAAEEDPRLAFTVITAMRYAPLPQEATQEALAAMASERLAAEQLDNDDVPEGWFEWMLWREETPDLAPHPSFAEFQRQLLSRIDPRFLEFLPTGVKHEIRLEEIAWGGVRVDGIPALTNPDFLAAADADYLRDDDLVFGVEINGDARAYPLRILNWHEMFNDVVGGVPVSLAYCTLCGAGILFDTMVEGQDAAFVFGSSGFLYRSNKLMYDTATRSLWNQFTGRPVVGPLVGSGIELPIRPVAITSWANWRDRNPDTRVLSLDTGFRRDYGSGAAYTEYFASPELMFPAVLHDDALAAKDFVFGLRLPGGAKAWPLSAFAGGAVINDRAGLVDVVLVGDEATRTVRAYRRDGIVLAAQDDRLDRLTGGGTTWTVTEEALLADDGRSLQREAGHVAYWFAWAGYLRDAELYVPPE